MKSNIYEITIEKLFDHEINDSYIIVQKPVNKLEKINIDDKDYYVHDITSLHYITANYNEDRIMKFFHVFMLKYSLQNYGELFQLLIKIKSSILLYPSSNIDLNKYNKNTEENNEISALTLYLIPFYFVSEYEKWGLKKITDEQLLFNNMINKILRYDLLKEKEVIMNEEEVIMNEEFINTEMIDFIYKKLKLLKQIELNFDQNEIIEKDNILNNEIYYDQSSKIEVLNLTLNYYYNQHISKSPVKFEVLLKNKIDDHHGIFHIVDTVTNTIITDFVFNVEEDLQKNINITIV